MSEIQAVTIDVNRYAPQGANAVDVYSYNGAEGLTFGQLVMAVCCRRGAAVEAQSVNVMNQMTATSCWLEALAAVSKQVLSVKDEDLSKTTILDKPVDLGASGYVPKKVAASASLKDLLQTECGIDAQYLDTSTSDKRIALFDQIKTKMDAASRLSQEQTIELQSLVGRRDVSFNTSAATIKAIGQSMLNTAALI